MSKKSAVYRNLKRIKMAEKYANARQKQLDIIHNPSSTQEDIWAAELKMQSFPKNSAKARIRNRCKLTGRARGNYRKFGLCRNKLRELAGFGEIPGLVKSSW
ncbi:MAG: 30S ribosomal protein S14 [Lactobacillaceae bacterium]|jgi:small subunit ribosomal protein S14|nr:30S ribosomal protein S14 [Lactobacillaceae bacterium]